MPSPFQAPGCDVFQRMKESHTSSVQNRAEYILALSYWCGKIIVTNEEAFSSQLSQVETAGGSFRH